MLDTECDSSCSVGQIPKRLALINRYLYSTIDITRLLCRNSNSNSKLGRMPRRNADEEDGCNCSGCWIRKVITPDGGIGTILTKSGRFTYSGLPETDQCSLLGPEPQMHCQDLPNAFGKENGMKFTSWIGPGSS
jgi:hypothetical protein